MAVYGCNIAITRTILAPITFHLATTPYHLRIRLAALCYHPATGPMVPFHSTSCRSDELPKSPFQIFVDVMRRTMEKYRAARECEAAAA